MPEATTCVNTTQAMACAPMTDGPMLWRSQGDVEERSSPVPSTRRISDSAAAPAAPAKMAGQETAVGDAAEGSTSAGLVASFQVRRSVVVAEHVAVPLLVGHRRPVVRIEAGRFLEPFLGHIEDVFVLGVGVGERAERDGEELGAQAQEAAEGDDGVGHLARARVDDHFLDAAQVLALGVDDVGADDVGGLEWGGEEGLLLIHGGAPVWV